LKAATGDSGREAWPRNPYTSQLFEKHTWRRVVNYLWKSSPANLVEKVRERLGADK
jgi:hypothetical protein